MKQVKFILSVVLAGASLFTSCRKETMTNTYTPTMASREPVPMPVNHDSRAVINYTLGTDLQTMDNAFQWREGQFNVVELFFNGTRERDSATTEPIMHGTPLSVMANPFSWQQLGAVTPPAGTYRDMTYTIRMFNRDGAPSVVLNGTFVHDRTLVPIQLWITEDIRLSGRTPGMRLEWEQMSRYNAQVLVNVAALGAGLETRVHETIESHGLAGGRLIITREAHPELYAAFLQNLVTAPLRVQVRQ